MMKPFRGEFNGQMDCLNLELDQKGRLLDKHKNLEDEAEINGLGKEINGKEMNGKQRLQAQSAHSKSMRDTSLFTGKALTIRAKAAIIMLPLSYLFFCVVLFWNFKELFVSPTTFYKCITEVRTSPTVAVFSVIVPLALLGSIGFFLLGVPLYLCSILSKEGYLNIPEF